MEENKVIDAVDVTEEALEAPVAPSNVPEKKKFSWKNFWDKVTTGLLILFLASPILVLAYIFIWFVTK